MKVLLIFLFLSGALFADVDLTKPLPRLRLPDGRILQDVLFVDFHATSVFVRSRNGPLSLRYEALPDEIRAAAEQKRPGGPKWFPGETADSALTLEGQVFVQTRGAGPYKFGNVKVYAFDAKHLSIWGETNGRSIQLPKPLGVATTDADGRFKLKVPKDTPYFVYCSTRRLLLDGSTDSYEWKVPGEQFKNTKEVVLGNETFGKPTKIVSIEETP